ncbi:MAG: phytoene desaturase family protein [Candidatus Hodarchaeota archaeon]
MSSKTKTHIVIIGAGFGGLSAAAILAHKGFKVTVLEKNESFGGRASVWRSEGFVFDMGPSWYLMPEIFDLFFANFDKKTSDFYNLIQLNPMYRIFFSKEDIIDIQADFEFNLTLFDQIEENGSLKLQRYLKKAENLYKTALRQFLYQEYSSLFSFFKPAIIKGGLKLGNFLKSLDSTINSIFSSDKAKKILEYSMIFLGSDPKDISSLFSLMSYVDLKLGVWYPEGGIGKVSEAIYDLSCSFGANYYFNQGAQKIEVVGKEAKIVRTEERKFEADVVLVNADYHHSETQLLDPSYRSYSEKYWASRTVAPSTFLIYLGLNKKLPNLTHHNLILQEWDSQFNSIFKNPKWSENPSYYVCVPSKVDSSVAPPEGENVFILVPVAPDLVDSEEIRSRYSEKVLRHFESIIDEPIHKSIVVKRIFSHKDFKNRYNAFKGTALGLSHTLNQTALWRPSHRSKKVKNLYYTGQYTHPGIGVPMTLISSQIVSDLLIKKYKNQN